MSEFAHVDQHYVPHVERPRTLALADPSVRALLGDELDGPEQLAFLIEFCALGIRMLRPVESTLERGASACFLAGLSSLGGDLERLRKDAVGRRLLLIDDLVQLATLWRQCVGGPRIDLAGLVRRSPPDAARRHAIVREAAIADPLSFAVLGVELELAEFALAFGPKLVAACERKLGPAVLDGLTYLEARREHAELRADDLLERLDDLLHTIPEVGESIAYAGVTALGAHLDVLSLCVLRGRRLVEDATLAGVA